MIDDNSNKENNAKDDHHVDGSVISNSDDLQASTSQNEVVDKILNENDKGWLPF